MKIFRSVETAPLPKHKIGTNPKKPKILLLIMSPLQVLTNFHTHATPQYELLLIPIFFFMKDTLLLKGRGGTGHSEQ